MPLLEYRANVDDAVDVRPFRGEAPDRRLRRVREEIRERAQALSARVGESVNAPGAIRTGRVAELHRLGVGEAHDGRRVEAHADR